MKEIFSRNRRKQTGTERKSTDRSGLEQEGKVQTEADRNRKEKSGNLPGSEPADPEEIHSVCGKERDAAEEHDEGGKRMKLKNILIVVKDIERSKKFYRDLFGLEVIRDFEGNVILTEGLVLQEEKIWREFLGKEIVPRNNACELYFEDRDPEAFVEKLEKLYPSVIYVNRLMTHSWGQKVVRFYDPDGNLIEVGTPV